MIIVTTAFSVMPGPLRRPGATAWSDANMAGRPVDSFIEGPCFDARGHLYVTDIPHGRIFRVAAGADWQVIAEYDGEPNGLACHPDGRLFIADYRRGLLSLDPDSGTLTTVLARRNSESFKGLNDLVFAGNGDLYFTDQGQTGLHDPTGRVFRLRPDGTLDCLIDNGPSPNGLALSPDERVLYVAMTRDNSVWRLPLMKDGSTSKVGRFRLFHGTGGPDGMAMNREGFLFVAHVSLGTVFVLDPDGDEVARIRSCAGKATTNVTWRGADQGVAYITESATGTVLRARLPELRVVDAGL